MNRRHFLKSTVGSGIVLTSGCLNQSLSNKKFSHPSYNEYKSQPRLGPELSENTPFIISFEDLSCPSCKHFHENTYSQLKEQYIDEGELSFVFRFVGFVQPWGDTAAKIQEAVYDKKSEKVFDIINSFYDRQSDIIQSNVYDISREILDENDLDSESIINEVQNGNYTD